MNINQLTCFISVADNASFSKAAIQLNWSQPAISKAVQDLEEELNVKLLNRTTRSVSLTPAGKYFLGVAKNVVRSLNIARENLRNSANISLQELTIGYLNTYADKMFMPILIRKLKRVYPSSNVHIIETFFDTMQSALKNGNITFTFCEEENVNRNNSLDFYPLLRSRYDIIVSPHDIFASKKSLRIEDLKGRKIILGDIKNYLPIEEKIHDKIIESVGAYNVTEAGDMMIMGVLVRSENIIGLLPEYGIDKNDPTLVSIPLTDLTTTNWGFAISKNISKNIDIKKLVNTIKSSFKAFAEINHFNSKLYK